jgi:PTH1 family peptidyl-tRNA hydrolase
VLDRVKDAVEVVLIEGISAAMNRFNRRPDDPGNGTDEPKGK